MGRRRKHDKGLPQRVYRSHGAYYFVDEDQKWIRLGKTEAEMYAELAKLRLERPAVTMADIFARYAGEVLPQKAVRTRKDNERELAILGKAFGHMTPSKITPQQIYQYMDARAAPVRANREKALLSHVFRYAVRWGLVADNPCRLVSRNAEKPRTRYVEDHEYESVHALAPEPIRAAMQIAVLTGMRQADILALTLQQCRDDGIHVQQSKTGKRQIFEWTEGLKAAYNLARATPRRIESMYLIVTREGLKFSSSGFQTAWQRLMAKCLTSGALAERFNFHDLRAKAGSEHTDAMRLLGHQSPTTTRRVYERKPDKVKPIR
ncbi:tyrosine-type recombinase/integrase [Methylotetracoccus oryzae]|uniref:tyrosine-type recombinase/integrase n=1 Tax=Methylotetracoccus oryzae TaxID=1919059 RepID=UPI00111A8311|nr:tyrosine-type recombinase/integrase [Methylotetracoccus oryzae]